jgi:hypothetical protein
MKDRIVSDVRTIWKTLRYGGVSILFLGFLIGVILGSCAV